MTIRQLGYPTKNALKAWCVDFEQNGDVLKRYQRTKPKYSEEQKKTAVSHFMANGRCIAATIRSLGYPSRQKLSDWVCELYPEAKQRVVGKVRRRPLRWLSNGRLSLNFVQEMKVPRCWQKSWTWTE